MKTARILDMRVIVDGMETWTVPVVSQEIQYPLQLQGENIEIWTPRSKADSLKPPVFGQIK
jgi:hypothetical protein